MNIETEGEKPNRKANARNQNDISEVFLIIENKTYQIKDLPNILFHWV